MSLNIGRSVATYANLLTAIRGDFAERTLEEQKEMALFSEDYGPLMVRIREGQKQLIERERCIFYVNEEFWEKCCRPAQPPEVLVKAVKGLLDSIPAERKQLLEAATKRQREIESECIKEAERRESEYREWAMENDPLFMVRDLRERVEKLEAKLSKR